MSITDVEGKRTVPIPDVLDRIHEILEKYRFEFAGSIQYDLPGLCVSMDVTRSGIFAGSRTTVDGSQTGSVFCRPLSGNNAFESAAGEIPVGTSSMSICCLENGESVVYPRSCDGKVTPVKKNLRTGAETLFEFLPEGSFTKIVSIKVFGERIVLVDILSNFIAEYSLDGEYLKSIPLPTDYRYPVDVEEVENGYYITAFRQGHFKAGDFDYSKIERFPDSYLVVIDNKGNIEDDLTGSCRGLFRREPIRALATDKKANHYVLTARTLVKTDPSCEVIYQVDMQGYSDELPDSEPGISESSEFYDMKYSEGKLYLLESITNKRIYVFNVA